MSESAPRNWKVGDVIADLYEVTGVLGEGAFGIVHKVHHRGWDMDLAVKSPRAEILGSEMAVRRFLREAETWVQLGLHPHIASCYYVRNLGGIPRMFIEYADAGTLRDWLRDGKVKDWHTILDIAIQICYGLSFAHKKGLVHRDLKPGNCLMTSDGTLKITDFGLVKLLGDMTRTSDVRDRVPGPEPVRGGTLTGHGSMGTPEYMAPEQWSNPGEATAAADIWAFGVMLYEMTCGRKPFETQPGEPADAFYARMIRSNWAYPAPRELRDGIYRQQVELIAQCLRPRAEDRVGSINDVASGIGKLCSLVVEVMPRPVRKGAESLFPASELDSENPQLQAVARRPPPEIPSLADTLNNQAVSLIDLGREDEALRLLDEALKVDPTHVKATFNQDLLMWREGRMTDVAVLGDLKSLREVREQDYEVPFFIGSCHMERGDAESALAELGEARQLASEGGRTPEVRSISRALESADRMRLTGESCRPLPMSEGQGDRVSPICTRPNGQPESLPRASSSLIGPSFACCASPDRQYELSGDVDKILRLRDLRTGKCLRMFEGHTDWATAVCISPDGQYALSGSNDKTLRLWKIATGKCLRVFYGHTDGVSSVCISPDGRRGLSGSWDHTLRLWKLATGECLTQFLGHTHQVWSVCIGSDGRYGLSGSTDKTMRLWELATGRCLRTFEGHSGNVWSVCISPDGRYGLSGSEDSTVRMWELATGRCLRTFEGHYASLVRISRERRQGLSAGFLETLRLWTLAGTKAATFSIVRPRPTGQVSADNAVFESLIADGGRAFREGHPKQAVTFLRRAIHLPGYERSPRAMKLLNEAGRHATKTGLVSAWNEKVLRGHAGHVYSVCISPDGRCGLSCSHDNTLRLWEFATGRCLRTFEGHTGPVWTACMSPNGQHGLSGSFDNTLRLWTVATGKCLRVFEGHSDVVLSVSISPDGRHVLSGSNDHTLRLWEFATARCLKVFEGSASNVHVSFSPDSQHAISVSGDKILRLWELATGKCLRAFDGHAGDVSSVSVSPDGRYGLSGSGDKTLRLWDLVVGKCLREFEGHTGEVTSVCIGPDGRYGLSGSADKTLRLWDLATGECLRSLEGHTEIVWSVSISPDGRHGLSCSSDKTARLWEFDWEYEFPEPKDWDERARPYLEAFLTLRSEVGLDGISRVGKPVWSDDDFKKLLADLSYRGLGWLRAEGVRQQLERMTSEWKGPPQRQWGSE
jgi:WD40 repeat protein/serine/threonine protein kinase